MGFKGDLQTHLSNNDAKAQALVRTTEEVKAEAKDRISAQALWRFFEAERDGDVLHLLANGGASPVHSFSFDWQPGAGGACLSDYVLDPVDGQRDHVVLFVATAGAGVRERSAVCYAAGEFVHAFGRVQARADKAPVVTPNPSGRSD